jgi:hypothetical protein
MAKLDRDESVRRGEALLGEWHVGADADAGALRAHAHRDPGADVAIAARLGAQAHDASLALLHEIAVRSADKLVHKEVKRALYRLEQRGIARPAEPAAPAALLGPQLEGYLSPLDGRGDQLVWLVRPLPGGGIAHLLAVINDPEGMRDTALHHTTRKALRSARQDLETKHEIRLVDADWRYCDFLMDRAFQWAGQRGTAIEGDYPGLRAQLVRTPASSDLPALIWSKLDAAAIAAEPTLLATSPTLLEEKEFRTWFFDVETLKPYLDEMLQVKDSPIVLSPAQQQERFRTTIEHALEELFGGERQASYARRLLLMAYVFAVTQRLDAARRTCAVALALEKSTQGGRDVPLCEQLVRTSLAAFFQMAAEQEQEQARSSLIMTPQQAAAQAAQQRRR